LHGPVVAAAELDLIQERLRDRAGACVGRLLELAQRPVGVSRGEACCPSSMVVIHRGSSGGGGVTTAESDVDADG